MSNCLPDSFCLRPLLAMSSHNIFRPFAVLVASTFTGAVQCFAAEEWDATSLEVARQGYLANREAFECFSCVFKVIEGKAASLEDARNGRLTEKLTRTGRWVVEGEKVVYELPCPFAFELPAAPPSPADAAQPPIIALRCMDERMLADANVTMRYNAQLGAVNIGKRAAKKPGISLTPISMGAMGMDESHSPAAILEPRLGKHIHRAKRMSNGKLIVENGVEADSVYFNRWLLDPERGFIPTEKEFFEDAAKPPSVRVEATDIRLCANGAFFPYRSVHIQDPHGTPPFAVRVIEVVRLDLDCPRPSSEFAIALPAETRVLNPAVSRSTFRLKAEEVVDLENLDMLLARTDDAAAARVAVSDAAENSEGIPWWAVIAIAISTVVAVAALAFLKRKNAAESAAH